MIEVKPLLKKIIQGTETAEKPFKRNLLKEQIHILVLDFIYAHPDYGNLVFYGGSALRHCFDLPRLSEDLDFVDLENKIDLPEMGRELETYFNKETDLRPKVLIQPSRVKLKFPILRELGLSTPSEYESLLIKIEVFKHFDYCSEYQVGLSTIFKFNRSVVIKNFDLPTMMATKIGAVLHRKWQKTAKGGEVLAKLKGRDYFDLVWYLSKGVKPNMKCIMGFKPKENLKEELLKVVKKVDTKSIKFDLDPLMENKPFVDNFSKNIGDILKGEIEQKL